MEKIDYQFVAVPLNLFCRLDNNLRSVLFSLIQLHSHYAEDDGWFYRSNADLGAQANLSENLVRVTTDGLYKEGLIDVESVGKGKGVNSDGNWYKIHFERFKDYEKDNIEKCCKDPRFEINTPKYKGSHYHCSYLDKNNGGSEHYNKTEDEVNVDCGLMGGDSTLVEDEVGSKVTCVVTDVVKVEDNIYNTNNLNNTNNIDNINNTNNINNKENILNNTIHDNISFFDCSRVVEMSHSEYEINELIKGFSKAKDVDVIIEHFKKVSNRISHLGNEKVKEYAERIVSALDQRCEELGIDSNVIQEYYK